MVQRWGQGTPLIGKSLAKFGRVGQMLASPCVPEPMLWVEAFFIGGAHAFWSLAKPSALGHGSPLSMSVFGSHSRTRQPKEPNMRYRANGELIPGPEFQFPNGLGWTMFKIPFFLARQVGWYLMIYDAFATGAYVWTSTAFKWAGCPVPTQPYAWCKEGAHLVVPNEHGTAGACKSSVVHDVAFGGGTAIIPGGSTYTAMFQCTSKPWSVLPNEFVPANGFLRNNVTGQTWAQSPQSESADGNKHTVSIARAQTAGLANESITAVVNSGGAGYCDIENSIFYVQIFPFDNLLADP